MDNQDSRAGGWGSSAIGGVDLNCYLARGLRAMAVIAEALGLSRKAVGFTEHAQRLEQLIDQTFWDETAGFYYDRHEREGRALQVKSVAGFIPLWALPLPQERADRLVSEHLLNPAETSTREYYNAETGCGLGLDPFWGWSSLAYLMPLEQELGYDPTDPACPIIQPLAARCLGLRFPS